MKIKIIIICILILSFALANLHFHNVETTPPKINQLIPTEFSNWKSKDIKIDKAVFKFLDPDELLSRVYTDSKTGKKIFLSIVLTDKRARIHDPNICYRMQNIEMDSEKTVNITSEHLAKLVLGKKGKESYDIIYWYTDLKSNYPERAVFMKQIALAKFLDQPMKGFALVILISSKDNKGDINQLATQINDVLLKVGRN